MTESNTHLMQALAETARTFTGQRNLDGVLQSATRAAVELIPGADSADILIIRGKKKFESVASTAQLPVELDRVQERLGEGPCVDAAADAFVTRSDDLEFETRWPRFTKAALDAGVASMLSFQLYTKTDTAGALNLFASQPNAFDAESVAIGEALAAHAAIAITAERTELQLHSAVASRDIIGQAKGMLMERFTVPADRAFEMLIALSQDTNTPLATVAARIVEDGT
ncbi:GAF and ANTAR domain-containing protein (plasmid) [Rhodococcus opacus]|uniref:GAF and ANTAR domain-containing protein n=1 Tax=Rhodococcus opacus TaxID=37919 RepID=UPI0034D17A1C